MKVLTSRPIITENESGEDFSGIDGTNDLQVRHFQAWSNSKKGTSLRLNGRLDRKTKQAYAKFGTEWLPEYKAAYPNLSTTSPTGQKVAGKLWDSTKKAWVTARDSGLLQEGLDKLGIKFTLPTEAYSEIPTSTPAGPSRTDAAIDAVDDLETELKKEKSKKFIKQAVIVTAIIALGYFGYIKFVKGKKGSKTAKAK